MEFWNWNFGRLFENGILKIKLGILEFLKNYFKKVNLRIEFRKIKFKKNWNLGELEFWEIILKSKIENRISEN